MIPPSSSSVSAPLSVFLLLTTSTREGLTNAPLGGDSSSSSSSSHHFRHKHANSAIGEERGSSLKKYSGLYTGPYFDPVGNPGNVTVQLGETALLPCRIRQLGSQTVSWVRKSDSHILTVDQFSYINDDRFFVILPAATAPSTSAAAASDARDGEDAAAASDASRGNDASRRPRPPRRRLLPADAEAWTLHIRYALPGDSGVYECQISTEPKMSRLVRLSVADTRVSISSGDDVHANTGSNVVFKCEIEGTMGKPAYVFWYHGSRRLMASSDPDSAVSSSLSSISPTLFVATLSLRRVTKEHIGNYSCSPSNAKAARVRLHVIDGEIRAAMSDSGVSRSSSTEFSFTLDVVAHLLLAAHGIFASATWLS